MADARHSGRRRRLADTGSDYRWYVDPLDGTTNFAHGFPVFCVSMGLEYKGNSSLAWFTIRRATKCLLLNPDGGAFLNQQRIHVSKIAKLNGMPGRNRLSQP